MPTLDKALAQDLLRFLMDENLRTKQDIIHSHPGLRSPTVCAILCEQALEELLAGRQNDVESLLRHVCMLLNTTIHE